MSNLVEHAKVELGLLGLSPDSKDAMDQMMYKHLIKMVETFSEGGHSGFSASYALSILQKLLAFEPVVPLTGEDSEWMDVSETMGRPMFQNVRCSHVFKEGEDGKAYDVEGKIFYTEDDRSDTFTGTDSWVEITFPYTPKREYVKVAKEQHDGETTTD